MLDKLTDITNGVSEFEDLYSEKYLLKFVSEVNKYSDYSDVNKVINFINEPVATGKKNIIYKLSQAFNWIKYNNIPIQVYIFPECYKIISRDFDSYNIDKNLLLFVNDIYFNLINYKWNNEKILNLRYYLVMLNIIWMIDFRWSNIYFLIQKQYHDEYYNQLLFYLISRFEEILDQKDYLGYSPRVIYSPYILSDITSYKFKNYNTLIDNIHVYKLLHKTYINNKWADSEKLREIIRDWIAADKRISRNYLLDENLDKLVHIITNPYTSEIDVIWISSWINDDWSSQWSITEESIEHSYNNSEQDVSGSIEDIIKYMWWDIQDTRFFLLYDIFFNK